MPRPPKGNIQSYEQMISSNQQITQSRLYARDDATSEKISAMVESTRQSLEQMPKKIDLHDTELVRRVALQYLTACDNTACLPSKTGVCRALGISRQAVDAYMQREPKSSTTAFLEVFFDACAELLTNAALIGGIHPIMSIFIAKSIYKYKEVSTLEVVNPHDALHDSSDLTAAEVAQKYAELPAD